MNLLGLGLSQSRFSPRKLRPSLYLSADRGVYQDAAVQFTAADKSWLEIADAAQKGLNPGTDDFLTCLWLKMDSYTMNRVIVNKGAFGSPPDGYNIFVNTSGKIQFQFSDGGTVLTSTASTNALGTSAWHFCAVFADRNGNAAIYLDGNTTPDAVLNISARAGNCTTNLAFGVGAYGTQGTLPDDGRIDSLMFFRAPDLSPVASDIIAWAYNSGAGRLCAEITDEQKAAWGAVSGWEFAEASGRRMDSWGTNHLDEMLGEEVTEIARAPGIVRAIAANGDGVSYWRDQSTGGKHAAQITLAKRPALVTSGINSRPVIRGDGVDDYLGVPAISLTGGFAISAVLRCAANPSALTVLGKDANNYIALTDNTTVTVRIAGGTATAFTVGAIGTGAHILTVTRDASDNVRVYLDCTESTTGAKTLAGTLAVEQVMAHGSEYFAGDIADMLVYDGEKTAAELARIHTYLARRYGITI